MKITKTRTGDTPENCFVEVMDGAMQSSLEVSINAKGQYQYSLKMYFSDQDELIPVVLPKVREFDERFREVFRTPPAASLTVEG